MAVLFDEDGSLAVVGKTRGRWLDPQSDFIFGGADHQEDAALELGPHGFPRDWPEVYSYSSALKSLVKKKGPCAAKRVSAVPALDEEQRKLVEGVVLQRLQSFSNAEAVKAHTGLEVVEGWAIYDLLQDVTGEGFVAERYWWNSTPEGSWLDATPRPERVEQLLLVEAVAGAPKPASLLSQEKHDLAQHLLRLRFPRVAAAASAERGPGAAVSPEELKLLVKRVELGLAEALQQALQRAEASEDTRCRLVGAGMCKALASQLGAAKRHAPTAVRLLALLARTAAREGSHELASSAVLAAGGLDPLLEMLAALDVAVAADAAEALANLCFKAPTAQARASSVPTARALVALLSRRGERCAGAAAHALWHLQVGRKSSSDVVLRAADPVPELLAVLGDRSGATSEEARVNAAGALMQLATASGAQDALGKAMATPILRDLLADTSSPRLQERAASTLANLLYRHQRNCRQAFEDGVLPALVALAEGSCSEVASEAAAAALANLLAGDGAVYGAAVGGDREVASTAVAFGAFEALLGQLVRSSGRGQCSVEVYSALANLAPYLESEQVELCTADIIQQAVAPLLWHDAPARTEALVLAMGLASHVALKAKLTAAGIIKPLVKLLDDDEKELRQRASATLANLMSGHSATISKVYSQAGTEVVKRLVELLEREHSTTSRAHAALALGLLATQDLPRRAAARANSSRVLVAVLEEEPLWQVAFALVNTAPPGKERRPWQRQLGALGAVPPLVQMLQHRHALARRYASAVLLNLTQGSGVMAVRTLKAGAVEPLLALMAEASVGEAVASDAEGMQQLLEWAAGTLGNLAQHGGESTRAVLVQNEPLLQAFSQLLLQGAGAAKEMAVFALAGLAESHPQWVRPHLVGAGPVLEALRANCRGLAWELSQELLDVLTPPPPRRPSSFTATCQGLPAGGVAQPGGVENPVLAAAADSGGRAGGSPATVLEAVAEEEPPAAIAAGDIEPPEHRPDK